MIALLRTLVFPRACIGCDRDDVLLCEPCARGTGPSAVMRLASIDTIGCVPYAGIVRDAIAEFKRGRRAFADDLAALALPFVSAATTLVPVPTTRQRRAERGFDQTQLLARVLRRRTGAGIAELLVRSRGPAQHGRSRTERLAATGRFRARRADGASPRALTLFDDVRTTGATLVDAARTLEAAGWAVAGALTIAWTPQEQR